MSLIQRARNGPGCGRRVHSLEDPGRLGDTGRMPSGVVLAMLLLAVPVLALAVLTALGEHRRGASLPVVVSAGVFFPLAWVSWYVRDRRALAR